MRIHRYRNEIDESFIYRVCYSALGQWCLALGSKSSNSNVGTTKHGQTRSLNELLGRYLELFPIIANRLVDQNMKQSSLSVFIRRVYEETGYLLDDVTNHNRVANYGRSIKLGNQSLLFGFLPIDSCINGLGVFSTPTIYEVKVKEFLIRDDLSCDEYVRAKFDPIDFYERDINTDELEYFNPLSTRAPFRSWGRKLETTFSVARRSEFGPFYRVMKTSNGIRFVDEVADVYHDSFTSGEYRRLYYSLKRHYENPQKAWALKIDDEYFKIRVSGLLPNREYYFLLLLAWPERSACDNRSFIIRASLLEDALVVLENIGFTIVRRNNYE